MEKRYQVFVSSTFQDLREERAEVIQALLELDCIPSGMELFPAGDDEQWTVIRRVIDECDYYIVIIAGRYGSAGPDGKSFTQMEYEYAVSTGRPVMAFLHEKPGSIPADRTEQDPVLRAALEKFREKVKKKLCKYWSSPKDLSGVVSRGIAHMKQSRPAIGWVRANLVPDESAAQEMLRLRKRLEETEARLALAQATPPPGTEDLAQGEESIELGFSFLVNASDFANRRFDFTWNELLTLLGPLLSFSTGTEDSLKGALLAAVTHRMEDKNTEITHVTLRDEDFQRVMLQFLALRWIAKAEGAEAPRWILTPYGDHVMLRTAAIKSSKAKTMELFQRIGQEASGQ